MSNALVSIIIPTYKHGHFIERTIQSVLKQTHTHWELFIIDDGSPDHTKEVVEKYLSDSRIQYIYQQNKGVKYLADTINVGLNLAKGEFVTMLGSDDTWPENRLEIQLPYFKDQNVVLCFGNGYQIDINDIPLSPVKVDSQLRFIENKPVGSALYDMFLKNYIFQYTVLIRCSTLKKIGGYWQPKGMYAEDYPTHLKLALEGEFRYINADLGNYRMHPNQMTRNHYAKMLETDMPFILNFYQNLPEHFKKISGFTEMSLTTYLEKRLYNTYFEVGRRELLANQWIEARGHFLKAIGRASLQFKLRSILGFIVSFFRFDLEGIIKCLGGSPLR